jgi:hypothetical protein
MLGQIREHIAAEDVLECGLASADAVGKPAPRAPNPVFAQQDGISAQRAQRVGAQPLGQRGQRETTVSRLGEHAAARQRPQKPVQRVRAHARGFGQRGR